MEQVGFKGTVTDGVRTTRDRFLVAVGPGSCRLEYTEDGIYWWRGGLDPHCDLFTVELGRFVSEDEAVDAFDARGRERVERARGFMRRVPDWESERR